MPHRAVVVGAGLAGMLAAAALSATVDEVVVVERDDLPDGPEHRKGLPQGRHAHLLMPGGLAAMEELIPGVSVRQALLAAGAHEVPLGSGMLALTPEGWLRRWRDGGPRMITCSRALLDWVVRDLVLKHTGVRVERGQALEFTGSRERVRGVRVAGDGGEQEFAADLVVEAGGRGSRIGERLRALGITDVREKTVDVGLVNATRVYRTPQGAENFPLTVVQADPYASRPGRSGMMLPIEGGRWMVSLAGTRGGEPPADPEGFLRYTLDLPHPIVGRLISGAEPLGDVHVSRSTKNTRRYLEKVRAWPEGLVVLGDAVATFNPAYGQGMSVAALGAVGLLRELESGGPAAPGLARRAQRRAGRAVEAAWASAVGQDIWFPDVRGGRPGLGDRLVTRYSRRLTGSAASSLGAARALWDVTSLRTGPTRLLRPDAVLAALTGPLLPPLSGPPMTPAERKILAELERGPATDA
ncbi:pyridine nucleotide-disulfide oxidoreductase [Streptomyces sp. Ru71]|uniref:NAD(P)/FAD-dependent oxidoreductase n=1 Tax=Streptomyces sp. Ru71 TaxID=2080746 RepID=UPI000CDDDA19|nr:FAD-dependent monooxygenase [Streptomyces sp. Ru71]POX53800.1 pyridine nucleotide-disulfide oxidoreductase [Streptomyces sp. Ru71]